MRIVFIGLSISSSWGNGHATNYRALVRELGRRGHEVRFFERDVPWYASHRDLQAPEGAQLVLYRNLEELQRLGAEAVRRADLVVQGSYVPDGVPVGDWVLHTAGGATAFYDIDTPITLGKLEAGDLEYLAPEQVASFDLYLSFTGGPTLDALSERYGARRPVWFPCLVDPEIYRPIQQPAKLALGYLGTYSDDRQPAVEALLLEVARRRPQAHFAVVGPSYPADVVWPANVGRIEHLAPPRHTAFYAMQRFTLNVTRRRMREAGWSPSVRLFEAAACGTPIISDPWPGLEAVLDPGREILVASGTDDVLEILDGVDDEGRDEIADRARRRVLSEHTAARRIDTLETYVAGAGQVVGGPR